MPQPSSDIQNRTEQRPAWPKLGSSRRAHRIHKTIHEFTLWIDRHTDLDARKKKELIDDVTQAARIWVNEPQSASTRIFMESAYSALKRSGLETSVAKDAYGRIDGIHVAGFSVLERSSFVRDLSERLELFLDRITLQIKHFFFPGTDNLEHIHVDPSTTQPTSSGKLTLGCPEPTSLKDQRREEPKEDYSQAMHL